MNIIPVAASKNYNVVIGRGLLSDIGHHAVALKKAGKAAIISDSNVWPIYGSCVTKSLTDAGFTVINYVFPAGEASKNGNTYLSILNFLAENRLTRSDFLIALGGGVVGDITGFAAATFLRGISYIQIPTTLLAMVDSSVGGKTAIDLPAGKNLAGAFYQPNLVLCDINTLNSLPKNIFRDGCAEVIKYGVLYDNALFSHLFIKGPSFDRESVISRCVALKRDVVKEDEYDTGTRQKLNLGHTIGHAIEAQSNFTVTHGQAVAIGMAIVSKAGVSLGICHTESYQRILKILDFFELPKSTDYSSDELCQSALLDKKRSDSTLNIIIPRCIGDCIIQSLTVDALHSFIEAGL